MSARLQKFALLALMLLLPLQGMAAAIAPVLCLRDSGHHSAQPSVAQHMQEQAGDHSSAPHWTTALFTAAGIAKANPMRTLPPFFIGKLVSNGIMIATGSYLASSAGSLKDSLLSPKSITVLLLGLIVLGGLLFLDWRELLEHKKLKFKFKIWK